MSRPTHTFANTIANYEFLQRINQKSDVKTKLPKDVMTLIRDYAGISDEFAQVMPFLTNKGQGFSMFSKGGLFSDEELDSSTGLDYYTLCLSHKYSGPRFKECWDFVVNPDSDSNSDEYRTNLRRIADMILDDHLIDHDWGRYYLTNGDRKIVDSLTVQPPEWRGIIGGGGPDSALGYRTDERFHALFIAFKHPDPSVLWKLLGFLRKYASPEWYSAHIHLREPYGGTLLHRAVRNNDLIKVKILIEHGVKQRVAKNGFFHDRRRMLPIDLAVASNSTEIIDYLLENPSFTDGETVDENYQDWRKKSAYAYLYTPDRLLEVAIGEEAYISLAHLIKKGADPTVRFQNLVYRVTNANDRDLPCRGIDGSALDTIVNEKLTHCAKVYLETFKGNVIELVTTTNENLFKHIFDLIQLAGGYKEVFNLLEINDDVVLKTKLFCLSKASELMKLKWLYQVAGHKLSLEAVQEVSTKASCLSALNNYVQKRDEALNTSEGQGTIVSRVKSFFSNRYRVQDEENVVISELTTKLSP